MEQAEQVISALDGLRSVFLKTYGFDGWQTVAIRKKGTLHSDPKVKVE
jgi:hypothetical protein